MSEKLCLVADCEKVSLSDSYFCNDCCGRWELKQKTKQQNMQSKVYDLEKKVSNLEAEKDELILWIKDRFNVDVCIQGDLIKESSEDGTH